MIGGLVGVGIGYGAAAIVQAVAPPLTASAGTGAAQGGAATGFARSAASAAHTVSVHLTAR